MVAKESVLDIALSRERYERSGGQQMSDVLLTRSKDCDLEQQGHHDNNYGH